MRGSIQTAPQILSGEQRNDRQQRGQGVGEDVKIGAAQIVVVVSVPVPMMESVSLRPVLVHFGAMNGRIAPGIEDEQRYPVDDKANDGDGDRPIERDRNRRHQARKCSRRPCTRRSRPGFVASTAARYGVADACGV